MKIKNIAVVTMAVVLSGCTFGQHLRHAGEQQESYKECVVQHLATVPLTGTGVQTVREQATNHVLQQCKGQEDAYVQAITVVARSVTGGLLTEEEFLENEEAEVREDLRDIARDLVAESLEAQ